MIQTWTSWQTQNLPLHVPPAGRQGSYLQPTDTTVYAAGQLMTVTEAYKQIVDSYTCMHYIDICDTSISCNVR